MESIILNGKEIKEGSIVKVITESGIFRKERNIYVGHAFKPRWYAKLCRIFSPIGRYGVELGMTSNQSDNNTLCIKERRIVSIDVLEEPEVKIND